MRHLRLCLTLTFLLSNSGCDDGAATPCGPGEVYCNGSCLAYCLTTGTTSTTTTTAVSTAEVTVAAAATPLTSPDCADSATAAGSLPVDYGNADIAVVGSTKTYHLHTNWWHLYDGQTVNYEGLSFTMGNPNSASSLADLPMGYPSMFIGSYAGHTTTDSNLPKLVSQLTAVPTVISTNAAAQDYSNHNAAYDVWFTDTSEPLSSSQYQPPDGGAYLMVWLFQPWSRQPRGSPLHQAITISGVEGTWDVWVDGTVPPCISYVSHTARNDLAFDLNRFIQDSVTNQYGITASMYLSVIFAGFEVWGGADGVSLRNFCANVN